MNMRSVFFILFLLTSLALPTVLPVAFSARAAQQADGPVAQIPAARLSLKVLDLLKARDFVQRGSGGHYYIQGGAVLRTQDLDFSKVYCFMGGRVLLTPNLNIQVTQIEELPLGGNEPGRTLRVKCEIKNTSEPIASLALNCIKATNTEFLISDVVETLAGGFALQVLPAAQNAADFNPAE